MNKKFEEKEFYITFVILFLISIISFILLILLFHYDNSTIKTKDLYNYIIIDERTHIMYYNYDSLCPYYSENGKLCKYEDGKIIELGD